MTASAEITRRDRPFNPSLDDLLAEYESSFSIEFSTNPDGPHSHLKLIRKRMTKFLDEKDVELLSNLDLSIPIHLVFSSNGFSHRHLVSNLRNNWLSLQTSCSIGSLCRRIFEGEYRLIWLRALPELVLGYCSLFVGLSFLIYAIYAASWLYVLIGSYVVFVLFLYHRSLYDILQEHVLHDEEFARQALSKHWVTVYSTDK